MGGQGELSPPMFWVGNVVSYILSNIGGDLGETGSDLRGTDSFYYYIQMCLPCRVDLHILVHLYGGTSLLTPVTQTMGGRIKKFEAESFVISRHFRLPQC